MSATVTSIAPQRDTLDPLRDGLRIAIAARSGGQLCPRGAPQCHRPRARTRRCRRVSPRENARRRPSRARRARQTDRGWLGARHRAFDRRGHEDGAGGRSRRRGRARSRARCGGRVRGRKATAEELPRRRADVGVAVNALLAVRRAEGARRGPRRAAFYVRSLAALQAVSPTEGQPEAPPISTGLNICAAPGGTRRAVGDDQGGGKRFSQGGSSLGRR